MNEEQQIEEMWKDTISQLEKIPNIQLSTVNCDIRVLQALYNAGYKKVGSNEIIISKDGIAKRTEDIEFFVKHNAEVRKEMAREILRLLNKHGVDKEIIGCCGVYDVNGVALAKEICEKYGVEVEE